MQEIALSSFEVWGLLLAALIVVLAAARKRYRAVRDQYERDSLFH